MKITVRMLAICVAILSTGVLLAAKGGGGKPPKDDPPPPPAGFIYFTELQNSQVTTSELTTDGSSVQHLSELDSLGISNDPDFARPYGTGFPSSFRYGTDEHRWWIYFKLIRIENPTPTSTRYYFDLYATPDGVTEIRITNFSDSNIVIGTNSEPPAWSTDSDLFVSFSGIDVDARITRLYRINISADDLEDNLNGVPTVAFPVTPANTLTEKVYETTSTYSGNFRHHAWSPLGDQVVFVMDDPAIGGTNESLWRLDVGSNTDPELIYTDNTSSPHVKWSPDGTLIALADLGDIIVLDPNIPESAIVVVEGSTGSPYTHPLWAPDGSQIACLQQTYSKRYKQYQYKIYSVSLDDFSQREIGDNADPLSYKRLLEWTPE